MFEHLLSPGRIGPIELRNRIVMSAMGTNLAEASGHAGERMQRYYEERARGGAGLVIVGVGAVASRWRKPKRRCWTCTPGAQS